MEPTYGISLNAILIGSVTLAAISASVWWWSKNQHNKAHSVNADVVVDSSAIKCKSKSRKNNARSRGESEATNTTTHATVSLATKPKTSSPATTSQHELYFTAFKGLKDNATAVAFSANGILAAIGGGDDDRTVRLLVTRTFPQDNLSTQTLKFHRITFPFDFASAVSFSEDSCYVACALSNTKVVQIYRIKRKEEFKPEFKFEFETNHTYPIVSLCMVGSGASTFLLTSSSEDDTVIKVWSPLGELISQHNSNQITNRMLCASPDNRLVALAAGTPEARVFQVKYGKSGTVEKLAKAMVLTGHRASISCVAFTGDVKRAVTSSFDGSWLMHAIDVRYEDGEDTKVVQSWNPAADGKTPVPIHAVVVSSCGTALAAIVGDTSVWVFKVAKQGESQSTEPSFVIDDACGVGSKVVRLVKGRMGVVKTEVFACVGQSSRHVQVYAFPVA